MTNARARKTSLRHWSHRHVCAQDLHAASSPALGLAADGPILGAGITDTDRGHLLARLCFLFFIRDGLGSAVVAERAGRRHHPSTLGGPRGAAHPQMARAATPED